MSTTVSWPGGSTNATPTNFSIPAAGEVNWASLSDFLISLGSSAQGTTFQKFADRVATTSPVTVSVNDCIVITKLAVPASVAVSFPAGVDKAIIWVADGTGDAQTNNVTITPHGADTIEGAATYVIAANGQAVGFVFNAGTTNWKLFTNTHVAIGTIPLASAHIIVGNASGIAASVAMSGDVAISNTGATSIVGTTNATLATLSALTSVGTSNLSGNNFLSAYATTATAAATTTLLVSSAYLQYFTGVTTQTVVLPVTSTLVLGFKFEVVNLSSGVVTVQSSGANTVQAMNGNTKAIFTCVLTSGTTAASWSVAYSTGTAGITALTGDVTASGAGSVAATLAATTNATLTTLSGLTTAGSLVTVGTITSGTWSATTIALNKGGTGQTTKTAAFDALSPMSALGDLILGGVAGTGARLGVGSSGNVLTVSGGTAIWSPPATSGTVTSVAMTVPTFLSIGGSPITSSGTLAVTLSGTALPIANGGTGVTSVTTTPTASSWAGWDANSFFNTYGLYVGSTAASVGNTSTSYRSIGNKLASFVLSDNATASLDMNANIYFNGTNNIYATTNETGALISVTRATALANTVILFRAGNSVASAAGSTATLATLGSVTGNGLWTLGISGGTQTHVINGNLSVTGTYNIVPTVTTLTSTGTTTGYYFVITAGNATIGATYTNNGNTFTVLDTIVSGTRLYTSGASAPQASGTLTRATGSGDATLTFSANTAMATFTTPANAKRLDFDMVGGGGGGGGSGVTGTVTDGNPGTRTIFGTTMLVAEGGGAGRWGNTANAGGTVVTGTGYIGGLLFNGGRGGGAGGITPSATTGVPGGDGAPSPFAGAGGGAGFTGLPAGAAQSGTGSGGGGGGTGTAATASTFTGSGGCAGAYCRFSIVSNIAASYFYAVGTGGAGGTAGTNGVAGGNGATGIINIFVSY